MKTLSILLALLLLPLSASATFYRGEIEYWFTSLVSISEGTTVGQVFRGWYGYECPTIDGQFFGESLQGEMEAPRWFTGYRDGRQTISFTNHYNVELLVEDGTPSFYWGDDPGAMYINFWSDRFNFGVFGEYDETGGGIVRFGAPSAVPESTSAIILLGLGLISLLVVSPRTRRRP